MMVDSCLEKMGEFINKTLTSMITKGKILSLYLKKTSNILNKD